jgi:putative endopeptidase
MEKSKFEKKIKIPEFSTTYHPGDNFYMYINDKWLKTTDIPDYESSYSVNEEIEELIKEDLVSILDNCSNFAEKGEKARTFENKLKDSIGRFELSASRINVQKNSIETLKKEIQNLRCIRSIEDIGETLGYFSRNKIDTIITTFLQLERTKNNDNVYTLIIGYGSLGLPDLSYYNATAPGKINTLIAYIEMIKEACKYLDIDDISEIVTLEAYFAAHMQGSGHEESILVKGHDLINKYKSFPWNTYFESYGIKTWKHITFRIQSDLWFNILNKTFETTSFNEWKNLFTLHIILHALPILPHPYNTLNFEFYGKRLRGQKNKLSQKQLTLELIKIHLTSPLSILYKKNYLKDSFKKNATNFIESIRRSALKQIENNTWIEEKTKKISREKIKDMVLSIGWPEYYPKLNLPDLQTDNLLRNIYLLSSSTTDGDIGLLNKKSKPGKIWDEPSFLVNAFYYNEINEFVVPAGSLFYPFYSEHIKTKGWNYGGIGAVIGHEMVHAFDDDGRKYDEHGYLHQWWLQRDTIRFHKISKKLVDLYNNSKILGAPIDGKLTLNENVADLGGLSIALEALKLELKGVSEKIRIHELQQFFISYAVSWRTKEEKQKVLQSLFMDKHAPPELRVNNIVCQFDEFYEAFDVVVANKMYVAPEDRIRIF